MSRRPPPEAAARAIEKYVEFHRLEPRKVGAFPESFHIPRKLYRAGKAIHVCYRSGKVDPETLRKPRRPVDYIHEHDAGVELYVAERIPDAPLVDVPERFRDVPALARLGFWLEFKWQDADGEMHEAHGTRPLPDLYTVDDGKCLLVVQSRRKVLAMMWGGALGVFARGIDG